MATEKIVPQEVVDAIREEYEAGGTSQSKLAYDYDLGESTIWRIVNRRGAYKQATVKIDHTLVSIPDGEKVKLDEMMARLLMAQQDKLKT